MKRTLAATLALALAGAAPALAQHAGHAGHGGMDHSQHGAHGAHAEMTQGGLKASSPAAGSTVSAPKKLVLTFAHAMKLDTVTLTGPNGVTLKLKGAAAASESASVALPALSAGAWKAAWHATSADGHMMHGVVDFVVR